MARQCDIAGQGLDVSEWHSDELGLIDRLHLCALLCEGLRLNHGQQVISSELVDVILDELRFELLHQVRIHKQLLNAALVQTLGQVRTIAHALFLLQEVELHLVDAFDLIDHPLLRLAFLQDLYEVEHVADHLAVLRHSFVCEGDGDLELGVAVVAVGSTG